AELTAQGQYPSAVAGYGGDLQRTFAALGLPAGEVEETDFVRMTPEASGDYRVRTVNRLKEVMPDVQGLGARDAVYILEKQGLRVQVNGSGRVRRQSVEAGQPIRKNDKVWLELN
ncbi:MAG: PASTA domain-containing protein, partial [Bacteroidales bacterium]|nr:PASTA domain-containing protein [Bacteroidales bacterium]